MFMVLLNESESNDSVVSKENSRVLKLNKQVNVRSWCMLLFRVLLRISSRLFLTSARESTSSLTQLRVWTASINGCGTSKRRCLR